MAGVVVRRHALGVNSRSLVAGWWVHGTRREGGPVGGGSRRTMAYKNLWGGNAPTGLHDQHKAPTVPSSVKSFEGGWRLDWEEDGRFVEWRKDDHEQSASDRERVQKEWTRFRVNHGRDRTRMWEHDEDKGSGFNRGSQSWWREQYYEYEYAGAGGVRTMESVRQACQVLEIDNGSDAGAVRAAYLRLVNKWHPDRFQVAKDKAAATEMFRKVSDAYNLLKER